MRVVQPVIMGVLMFAGVMVANAYGVALTPLGSAIMAGVIAICVLAAGFAGRSKTRRDP